MVEAKKTVRETFRENVGNLVERYANLTRQTKNLSSNSNGSDVLEKESRETYSLIVDTTIQAMSSTSSEMRDVILTITEMAMEKHELFTITRPKQVFRKDLILRTIEILDAVSPIIP